MITVLSLLVIINVIILVSGRLYIYKGLSATYFRGVLRPTIYDHDVFNNRVIEHETALPWQVHQNLGKFALSAEQNQYVEALNPASFLVVWGDTVIFEKYWGDHKIETTGNSLFLCQNLL